MRYATPITCVNKYCCMQHYFRILALSDADMERMLYFVTVHRLLQNLGEPGRVFHMTTLRSYAVTS